MAKSCTILALTTTSIAMKKYKHLSQEQRYHIYALKKAGASQKSIAQELAVSPSTISRELKRNTGLKGYRPKQAQQLTTLRVHKAACANVYRVPEPTKQSVKELLKQDWSPEQIANYLSLHGSKVSHESIYRMVISDRKVGGELYKHLRCRQRKYNRRQGQTSGRGLIVNRTPIEQRSVAANNRTEYGHWEADTVIGTKARGKVLVTLVERKSRYLIPVLAQSKSAEHVTAALIEAIKPFNKIVRSITFDNGKEFAYHEQIASALDCQTFFANPYHSWERGTNENTNGLLRQYFPKGVTLDHTSDEEVSQAQRKINTRPKKILGYNTPEVIFTKAFKRYERSLAELM